MFIVTTLFHQSIGSIILATLRLNIMLKDPYLWDFLICLAYVDFDLLELLMPRDKFFRTSFVIQC